VIILDTNVVSEIMRPRPAPGVMAFLDTQADASLYLTAVTVAEIMGGVESHKDEARRDDLRARADRMLALFAGRELPFDHGASLIFGTVLGETRRRGIAVSFQDCMIAAIALHRGCAVATRDTTPFRAAHVDVIDPFEGGEE